MEVYKQKKKHKDFKVTVSVDLAEQLNQFKSRKRKFIEFVKKLAIVSKDKYFHQHKSIRQIIKPLSNIKKTLSRKEKTNERKKIVKDYLEK